MSVRVFSVAIIVFFVRLQLSGMRYSGFQIAYFLIGTSVIMQL